MNKDKSKEQIKKLKADEVGLEKKLAGFCDELKINKPF